MWQELVPPPQYSLGVVDAALDGHDVVDFDPVVALKHALHVVELRVLHHIDLELDLELEGVVRVALVELRLVIVDLLVCLVKEVVEFVSELVGLFPGFFCDVVTVTINGLFVRLTLGLTWDVEVTWGTVDTLELGFRD